MPCIGRVGRRSIVTCRAGLYKQLAELKGLVAEYRENPEGNAALKVSPANINFTTNALGHAKQACAAPEWTLQHMSDLQIFG